MSASIARKTRRHGTRATSATRPIPSLLLSLVARTQAPDPFAHAWSDYVDTHIDPEELNNHIARHRGTEPMDPFALVTGGRYWRWIATCGIATLNDEDIDAELDEMIVNPLDAPL